MKKRLMRITIVAVVVVIALVAVVVPGLMTPTESHYCGHDLDAQSNEILRHAVNDELFVRNYDLTHSILHICHEVFTFAIQNPRRYAPSGHIHAGVVPHHITAATMISGFFSQAAEFNDYYDLVLLLAPNHFFDVACIVVSCRNWDIGAGVTAHDGFVRDILYAFPTNAAVCHARMEEDHGAAILVPFVYHYLPGTKIAPVLLNRSLSFAEIERLFIWLKNWLNENGYNPLIVASIDFSHFLTPPEAYHRDAFTKNAIKNGDLRLIHGLSDYYLDSPAAMIIFLKFLQAMGLSPEIIDHACASHFLGAGIDETTTYMIIRAAQPNRVRLTFTGDIMLHEAQMEICFDHTFSKVQPFLQSADLAIGNLETVLGGFFSDFPLFSAPDNFGYAIKNAGFNLLSTANNHSLDQGVEGLLRTLDFLHGIGISTFGTYRNQAERDTILVREAGGIKFAFLAYTFGTNGQPIPRGREYLVNIMHKNLISADISRAREQADIVIVMPHMGNEYELFVRQEFKDWAMFMLQSGADIVVAGHPHVVQPMGFVYVQTAQGQYRRGFVAYCLGNFVSSQRVPPTEAGVMLNLYFERRGGSAPALAGASIVPTWVKFTNVAGMRDIIILPVEETLAAIDAGEETNIRTADIARMREVLADLHLTQAKFSDSL